MGTKREWVRIAVSDVHMYFENKSLYRWHVPPQKRLEDTVLSWHCCKRL